MFCYQCEQTAKGSGCTTIGVCEKTEDIQSLQDTLLFGLKGMAAYAYHARELGSSDDKVDAFISEALYTTATNVNFDANRYVNLVLKCGEMNLRTMEMLNNAHTSRFGNPTPTEVSTGTRAGPGILITGHDLIDLHELLKQTEGTGINVYTHGEMLPAHAYPEFKKFSHLAGNFGGAWQKQKDEFARFPGAILASTNCILLPKESYEDRLFTSGMAGIPGATHIEGRNFQPLIDKAKSLPPLADEARETLTTGFHYTAILGVADKVVNLVKTGKIRHFFLVGGCDGAKSGRNYFADFVEKLPRDTLVLTLACGKYRFNNLDLGTIDGLPRLMDIGQCNDAYSAIQVVLALAKAFDVGVNELPLSIVLSWYEQKAVAILLTLLHLGIKDIRIGPSPPAFISANVFKILQDTFGLKMITTPEQDIAAILG